jgi:hypothetical protein
MIFNNCRSIIVLSSTNRLKWALHGLPSRICLVGFGSGSKLQGDLGGQLFGQIADWTAATTIGVGWAPI